MKRIILIALAGLVVVALGANWYYTREIRQQLDRVAAAASMFGTLSYDSVRLSPRGAIHINALEFLPRGGDGQGVRVDRIALRTGGLGELISLKREVESGRLPPELGIELQGLAFSLGDLPPGPGPAFSSPAGGGAPVGGFAAAGCDGRSHFSIDDLIDMDYYLIDADLEAHYRLIDGGRQIRQFVRVRSRDAGEFAVEAIVDLMAGSRNTTELMLALQRADLRSFSLAYEDLGFYDRMLAFCAARTDMDRDDYIAHHIEAWQSQWAALGARPAPELVEAYSDFVESPDRFQVRSRTEYAVALATIGEYALPDFLERMDTVVSISDSDPVPVDIEASAPAPRVAGSGDAPAEPGGETDSAAERGRFDDAERARGGAERIEQARRTAAARAEARWRDVAPADLADHIDRPVRVEMRSGRRFFGRLERIEPGTVHLRFVGDSGYYVRPLSRDEVRAVAVRDGVP